MRKRILELSLLALLAFSPLVVVNQRAHAADSTCNGTSIGMWCNLRYDDPTICQDCVQINCDVGCFGHSSQEYYYCHTVGFLWCLS
jgi:hypothetical protein